MKTTTPSGTNNPLHKRDNKGRYPNNNRGHHRYNNGENSYDQRVRHSAKQSLEKYLNLAREATVVGDKISSEYYLQYADHFHRVYHGLNNFDENGERKATPRYNAHPNQRHHRSQTGRDHPENGQTEHGSELQKNLQENNDVAIPVKGRENGSDSSVVKENTARRDTAQEESPSQEDEASVESSTDIKKKSPLPLRQRRPLRPKKEKVNQAIGESTEASET